MLRRKISTAVKPRETAWHPSARIPGLHEVLRASGSRPRRLPLQALRWSLPSLEFDHSCCYLLRRRQESFWRTNTTGALANRSRPLRVDILSGIKGTARGGGSTPEPPPELELDGRDTSLRRALFIQGRPPPSRNHMTPRVAATCPVLSKRSRHGPRREQATRPCRRRFLESIWMQDSPPRHSASLMKEPTSAGFLR